MTFKHALQILLVAYLSICYNIEAVGGRRLSKEEDLELDEQLKRLNKPFIKTIQTKYGDIYDCVDFYKQPAFDHPLLKNHNFHPQMKPTYTHRKMEEKSSINYIEDIGLKGESCPVGTVPIRRTTKDDLIRAKTHASNIHPLGIYQLGVYQAVVRTKLDQNKKNIGAAARIAIYRPEVKAFQYSSARITLQNGPDYIQAGWTVNPPLYGDNQTRLFVFFKAGETFCYNTQCPGFVVVLRDFRLGYVFESISNPSLQYDSDFILYRDPSDGNWWLAVNGDDINTIGFWPRSIFTSLKDSFTYIDWGGETYAPPPQFPPPMGSGHYVSENQKTDAYCIQMRVFDENNHMSDAKHTEEFTDDERFYQVKDEGKVNHEARHSMYFGGPGGHWQTNNISLI